LAVIREHRFEYLKEGSQYPIFRLMKPGTLWLESLLDYAKWAIMCYTGFIFALIYGFTGFTIAPKIRDDETIPGS